MSKLLITLVCILLAIAFLTIAERKVLVLIQRRKGPNVTGFVGTLQAIAESFKSIFKGDVIPVRVNQSLKFNTSPLLAILLMTKDYVAKPIQNIINCIIHDFMDNCGDVITEWHSFVGIFTCLFIMWLGYKYIKHLNKWGVFPTCFALVYALTTLQIMWPLITLYYQIKYFISLELPNISDTEVVGTKENVLFAVKYVSRNPITGELRIIDYPPAVTRYPIGMPNRIPGACLPTGQFAHTGVGQIMHMTLGGALCSMPPSPATLPMMLFGAGVATAKWKGWI